MQGGMTLQREYARGATSTDTCLEDTHALWRARAAQILSAIPDEPPSGFTLVSNWTHDGPSYRLSDMVRGQLRVGAGEAYHRKFYPSSIAVEYMDKSIRIPSALRTMVFSVLPSASTTDETALPLGLGLLAHIVRGRQRRRRQQLHGGGSMRVAAGLLRQRSSGGSSNKDGGQGDGTGDATGDSTALRSSSSSSSSSSNSSGGGGGASLSERRRSFDPSCLAVHVRTGDVIQDDPAGLVDILSRPPAGLVHPFTYVRSLCYYGDRVARMRQLGVKCVTLISGAHTDCGRCTKQWQYLEAIRSFLRSEGFDRVHLLTGGEPDEDFERMVSAKYFMPSGGGYSDLAAGLSNYMGHTVIN